MTTVASSPASAVTPGVGAGWAAMRARFGLVALLFALAGAGWWWAAHEMRGMDNGPWSALGGIGWFLGLWVVMMAAMMVPSVAPTVALYSRMTRRRSSLMPLLFVGGYLVAWAAAGLAALGIGTAASALAGSGLEWDHAGRVLAGVTLLMAAGYQLSPLKDVCLGKCRSPLGVLLGAWRDGGMGAVRMGMKHGAWCLGCCWALMASLFALGVMSLLWMAVVTGVIAIEKTVPWRRPATYATSIALLAVGIMFLVAPSAVPGLTIPHDGGMSTMTRMGA